MLPPLRGLLLLCLPLLLAPLVASQQTPSRPPPAPTDQEQIVPYWTTETGWTSELQLRNNQAVQDLTVTPVLRTAYGAETALAPVTIKSEEVKSIDLDAAIGTTAPQLVGTYGSLVLRYRSPGFRSLYASLMVRNIGHPFVFHIDATIETQDLQAGSREGIWWLPKDTTSDYLILTNQGKITLPLDLSLYDANGKESNQKVLLGPHEAMRYSVRKLILATGLSGSYGGIKVSAASHAGSLDTVHFLFDEAAAFSAILKMFDRDPNAKLEQRDFAKTAVWTLRAPMLALSSPDPALAFPAGTTLRPQLFIRNTTGKPVDAALRFNWRADSASGKAAGPTLRLNPYETRRIDVAALQSSGLLSKQANWTSVTLTTNGSPDEVMAVATSYDDTLRYGAQTPFSDQLSFRWEGGMWEYDAYHSSIITAGNGGTKSTQAAFTIFYNQAREKYELEQTLQPDEQMWVDVGKLIREHVPDKNGKTLPADLSSGSYEFRDLTDIGIGSLFEGKIIYDKTYGHAAYGCANCCDYHNLSLDYSTLGIPYQGTAQNGVGAIQWCTDQYTDISSSFLYGWQTGNTGITTVNYMGTYTGVGVGSTTAGACGKVATGQQRNCPAFLVCLNGTANVYPVITSISPAKGPVGATTSVTLSGNGFGSSPTVNVGSGITVTVNSANNTQIRASFAVSSSPTGGNNFVTVTASGQTSNSVKFYVQIPTSLSIVAGTDSTTTEAPCTTSGGLAGCGITRTFKYQVNDQENPPQPITAANMTFGDVLCNTSTNQLNLQGYKTTCGGTTGTCSGTPGPCGQFTDSNGQFTETLTVCAPACKPSGTCTTAGQTIANQTWTLNGVQLNSDVKSISYQCNKILVNGK